MNFLENLWHAPSCIVEIWFLPCEHRYFPSLRISHREKNLAVFRLAALECQHLIIPIFRMFWCATPLFELLWICQAPFQIPVHYSKWSKQTQLIAKLQRPSLSFILFICMLSKISKQGGLALPIFAIKTKSEYAKSGSSWSPTSRTKANHLRLCYKVKCTYHRCSVTLQNFLPMEILFCVKQPFSNVYIYKGFLLSIFLW